MRKRGIIIRSMDKYNTYFAGVEDTDERFAEHDIEYFMICYYNLREKYLRGQKDFSKEQMRELKWYTSDVYC